MKFKHLNDYQKHFIESMVVNYVLKREGIEHPVKSKVIRDAINMRHDVYISDRQLRAIISKIENRKIMSCKNGFYVPVNPDEFEIGIRHLKRRALSCLKRLKEYKNIYPEFTRDPKQMELFKLIDGILEYMEEK